MAATTGQIRVRLLRPALVLLDASDAPVDLRRAAAKRLAVAALAAAAPGPIGSRDLALFASGDALARAIERVAKEVGSSARSELAFDPEEVDLHRVLREASKPVGDAELGDVPAALTLVHEDGACPELTRLSVHAEYVDAVNELRERARVLRSRRILIVEDEIGDDLAHQFGRHECVVVPSWEAFKERFSDHRKLHQFDLALVDLRLSPGIDDQQGEQVRTTLQAAGVRYPIVMMTANAWEDLDVTAYSRQHGVFVVLKGKARSGRSASVVQRVHSLLDGPGDWGLQEQLRDQLVALRELAVGRIRLLHGTGEAARRKREEMNKEWARLWLLLDQDDPGRVRSASARFAAIWNPAPVTPAG